MCLALIGKAQSLTGIVKSDSTHKPLKGVLVYLPDLKKSVLTDGEGAFSIPNLPSGQIAMQFYKEGYKSFYIDYTVKPGANMLNVNLKPYLVELDEVVVTGFQSKKRDEVPWTINTLQKEDIAATGALTLTDAVSHLPGVSELSTGTGISKPIIRGLGGNRIQTNFLGVRFDNQQWQDEHGLGLSDVGIDEVEVIKGPASLLYGSEAIGGVLNIIDEKPAPIGKPLFDFGIRLFSNTLGMATEFGYKKSTERKSFILRAGIDSHADYSDGKGTRVLNSRFQGYYLKSSLSLYRKNFSSINSFYTSFNQFGFIADSLNTLLLNDSRFSRAMDGPKHLVFLAVGSTQNTWYRGKEEYKLIGGLNSNLRMEDEGGSHISLNMLLNALNTSFLWQHHFNVDKSLTLGCQIFAETNTNFGSRVIIPDATMGEASAYGLYVQKWKEFNFQGGLRYDRRQVNTYSTEDFGQQDTTIAPFSRGYNALNASIGGGMEFWKYWQVKLLLSTGFRSGNLAELSSNGLHEGTYRYEIGNPNLKTEKNLNTELNLNYESSQLVFGISAYTNRFADYIYLAPTGREYVGFQIYKYMQSDAALNGAEAWFDMHLKTIKWIGLNGNYSMVRGLTATGDYLPLMPADRFIGNIKFYLPEKKKWDNNYLSIGLTQVAGQDRLSELEKASGITATHAYTLFNASAGTTLHLPHDKSLALSLTGTNLTNVLYADYLSRLRYFGIYDMGRNIIVNAKLNF
jgi:iron complex outermembrane receptor protein